jgi:hypothetical protein
MKCQPDGFQRYLQLRQEVLALLTGANVEVRIAAAEEGETPKLRIQVKDTGAGFDYRRVLELPADASLPFGRGIPLVKRLCEKLEYRGSGNEVEVVFALAGEPTEGCRRTLNPGCTTPLTREDAE